MTDQTAFKIIAIDGGAATGKSSASRALAERFNCMHVDTGAHYRTLTLALLRSGASAHLPETIATVLDELHLGTELNKRSARLSVNGATPTNANLRSPEINATVAEFAAIPEIRQFLFDYQRNQAEVARQHAFAGLIMEGRDIGSVIFPEADWRLFLYADEATRAARRAGEGQTDSVTERDRLDQNRKTAPLLCSKGSLRVDTTPLSLEEVVDLIASFINTDK